MRTVAILIFDGVELMDVAGPAEVFIVAEQGRAFRVLTVAETGADVRTMGDLVLRPGATCAEAPRADVVVVPGGNLRGVGPDARAWLRKAAAEAEVVLSVCMGAFLLADLGLLDGLEATTHAWGLERLARVAPTAKVVSGRRFVDNGRVVTTAGVTAGIDGALHVVGRLLGPEAARWAGAEWMEHPLPPAGAPAPSGAPPA